MNIRKKPVTFGRNMAQTHYILQYFHALHLQATAEVLWLGIAAITALDTVIIVCRCSAAAFLQQFPTRDHFFSQWVINLCPIMKPKWYNTAVFIFNPAF